MQLYISENIDLFLQKIFIEFPSFFFLQKISSCVSTANIYVIFFISSSRQYPEHRTNEKYNLEIRRSGQTQQEKPHTPKTQTAHNDKCQRGRNTRFTPKGGPRIHRRTSRSFFYKRSQAVFRQRISTSYRDVVYSGSRSGIG